MSTRYAFVTLLTSDAYLPGALTIPAALNDVHKLPLDQTVEYETICLVTPETVDVTTIRLLRKAFNVVIAVETIVPPDSNSLTLLGMCPFVLHIPHAGVSSPFPPSLGSYVQLSTCILPPSPRLDHQSMQRCFLLSYHHILILFCSI